MKRIAAFISGVLVWGLLLTGIGFAGQKDPVKLFPVSVQFVVNGKEIVTEQEGQFYNGKDYVPTAFIYKGTTYVPYRFLSEHLGKRVEWDGTTRTITVKDINENASTIAFLTIDINEAPEEIQQWVERNRKNEATGTRNYNGKTYLLVTRGQKCTGGYGVTITDIQDLGNEIVVKVQYRDPAPGAMVPMVLTYPYALAVIDKTEEPVRFDTAGMATKVVKGS
ncbi:MAG: protease complex subunit PrcB family protein [Peptococcaceae bacterium]|nr:protease complex subunit PrcB family protein [Peptococcaceae bacterium]